MAETKTTTKKAVKATAARKVASAPKTRGVAAKAVAPADGKPVLLSGDNPQIPKGEGKAPVQAYLTAIPGWKREIACRVDAIVERVVPEVRKAVKWNSPFYGIDGRSWFLCMHMFTHYVKITFFRGTSLNPVPPGTSKTQETRYLDIREGTFDEAQFADWVAQASRLPGERL